MLPVISVNACVVANPSLLSRFMSCSPEDPLPGRSAALSGQLVIESFYSSLRVAVIVCPLRAADLPGSGPPGQLNLGGLCAFARGNSQLAQVASLSSLAKPQRTQNLLHFYFVIEFRINSLRGSRYSASRFQYSLLVNCQSPPPRFLLTLLGKLFMELI